MADNVNISSKNLTISSIFMLFLAFSMLLIITFEGILTPIILFIIMLALGVSLTILIFRNESLLKVKLFIFFFSIYMVYMMINHFILLNTVLDRLPFDYVDEKTLFHFSNLGLPYISGEKPFFDLFNIFEISELPLHVVFSSSIAYLSIEIDGTNTIIVQKLLSPFFAGIFSVFLYSTLKYVFKSSNFALYGTFIYGIFSTIFIYSIAMLRDIDIALVYMIFVYIFLQKNSLTNFILLFVIAYMTTYLRLESGMVLFGLILIYTYFYVKKLESSFLRRISYIVLVVLFAIVFFLMLNKILSSIISLDSRNIERSVAQASSSSIGILLNKLPFGISHTAKLLFGQLQPFPFLSSLDKLPYAISGIFWPFIFLLMIHNIFNKNIRVHINEKIKYLLFVAIGTLLLMSSEPMTRRMMSVYPIIYLTALYIFYFADKNYIKRMGYYYLFGIFILNVVYYFLKLR